MQAEQQPSALAIAVACEKYRPGRSRAYHQTSFFELERRVASLAAGLQGMGLTRGHRIVLLVRFGEDFITLVFALLRLGVTLVLIDPGMGRKNVLQCIEAVDPHGFVAIPMAQAMVRMFRHRFPSAKYFVTVGNRYGVLPGPTLLQLEKSRGEDFQKVMNQDIDQAAIIYTTGSTGPPKGVLYTHGTFNHQIDQLVAGYGITPGGKDLSGFPLFGLFNAMMGTSTIVPDMDPTKPADVDPPRILDAIDQWQVNQSFGSPALWTKVGRYCRERGRRAPSLRRVMSAGAPVSSWILEWMREIMHHEGEIHTPYGATEALPVATIESREILGDTARLSQQGRGTCVGARFSGIQWKVIRITDQPIMHRDQIVELPHGEIGELMVSGPVVTTKYVTRTDQNALHKVQDGQRVWHRMGDVGYLDQLERFWFCGRKSHRVEIDGSVLFTEPCESILNQHKSVYRSALVGVGLKGKQEPVVIVEPWPEHRPRNRKASLQLVEELRSLAKSNTVTQSIEKIMIYPRKLPTDIRHNAKIFREKLEPWASQHLSG